MAKQQLLLVLLLVALVAGASGCLAVAAVGAGAGTVAYMKGDLETVEASNIKDVQAAVKKAVEELKLSITKETKDAMSATLVARDAQDKKITIKLTATTEGTTKLSIRVGTFGNETKSRMIYNAIRDNL
ncbi:MAG: DUF3568 family protein [Phycisphaerales bacterium]|nr:MAG: DUF3568 family protein [Phycisphaerales bacterium]